MYLSTYLCICVYLCVSVHICACLYVSVYCVSSYLSICLSVHLRLYVCVSTYLLMYHDVSIPSRIRGFAREWPIVVFLCAPSHLWAVLSPRRYPSPVSSTRSARVSNISVSWSQMVRKLSSLSMELKLSSLHLNLSPGQDMGWETTSPTGDSN